MVGYASPPNLNSGSYVYPTCIKRNPTGNFQNYAITVDIPVSKSQNVICFFPAFNNLPSTSSLQV
jgi:hypothetical protein